MTQEELAAAIGTSRKSISEWEVNLGAPQPQLIPKLCRILEVSPSHLLAFEGEATLRDYRTALGVPQAQLAEQIGLSRSTVGRVERGDWHPRDPTSWADALGISLDAWEAAWRQAGGSRSRNT